MEVRTRIGILTLILMLLVAGFFDGIQFLLTLTGVLIPLAMLVGPTGIVLIGFWLLLLGVKPRGRMAALRVMTFAGGIAASFIPVINILPEVITFVLVSFISSRMEEARDRVALVAKRKAQAVADRRATERAQAQAASQAS